MWKTVVHARGKGYCGYASEKSALWKKWNLISRLVLPLGIVSPGHSLLISVSSYIYGELTSVHIFILVGLNIPKPPPHYRLVSSLGGILADLCAICDLFWLPYSRQKHPLASAIKQATSQPMHEEISLFKKFRISRLFWTILCNLIHTIYYFFSLKKGSMRFAKFDNYSIS